MMKLDECKVLNNVFCCPVFGGRTLTFSYRFQFSYDCGVALGVPLSKSW